MKRAKPLHNPKAARATHTIAFACAISVLSLLVNLPALADLPKTKVEPIARTSELEGGQWRHTCRFTMGISGGAFKPAHGQTKAIIGTGDVEVGCRYFSIDALKVSFIPGEHGDGTNFSGGAAGPRFKLTDEVTLKTPALSLNVLGLSSSEIHTNVLKLAAIQVQPSQKLSDTVTIGLDASATVGATKEDNQISGSRKKLHTIFGETQIDPVITLNFDNEHALKLAAGLRGIAGYDFNENKNQVGLAGQEAVFYEVTQKSQRGYEEKAWARISIEHPISHSGAGLESKKAFYDNRQGNPLTVMISVGALN